MKDDSATPTTTSLSSCLFHEVSAKHVSKQRRRMLVLGEA
jgi:hypothetical protein